ncbi:MAG TPA: PilZ domain-containing protein [Kofleriaceae bacterium]|nr:PilZ domain-containing protein [Kofleriaceae bacterium]
MDKREATRVPVRVPALCRARGIVIDGFVEDVSRHGMFLRAPKLVAAGSQARLEVELPGEPTLYLDAEVVRVEHSPERAGMGLRILVDARDSRPLANFIMRHHAATR